MNSWQPDGVHTEHMCLHCTVQASTIFLDCIGSLWHRCRSSIDSGRSQLAVHLSPQLASAARRTPTVWHDTEGSSQSQHDHLLITSAKPLSVCILACM